MESNCNTNYLNYTSEFHSDDEAIFDYDEKIRYTYGDLEKRSNILGNYMKNKIDIQKGDRIAFCSHNCIELFDAYYSTAKIGAILTTYNPGFSEKSLLDLVKNETPKILFYENECLDKINFLKENNDSIEVYVNLSNDIKTNEFHYSEILEYRDENKIVCQNDLEDIHLIIHTGGTTGIPKGAMISYRALLFNVLSEISSMNISKGDVAYVAMPMFHTTGWNVMTMPTLFVGGRLIITKKFQTDVTMDIIENEKVTVGIYVSTMLRMMMNHPRFDTTNFSSLRWLLSGGASTPDDILNKYWENNIKVAKAYGMTEIGPNNIARAPDNVSIEELKKKGDSVGKPMIFNSAKIIDDSGEIVKQGEVGELLWSGSLVFSGYWNNPEETKKILNNGWISTGDLARQDDDGYYYIVGRKKNMFISGGENIFPLEIQNVIGCYYGVNDVVVIGVADTKWGEVGKAIIEVESEVTISKERLIKYSKSRLGTLKTPKYFEFIEKIPKNSSGKVKIQEVIQQFGTKNS
jgi:fatty-acyl-CoA synthase